jgi:REP element-mobilizing transposase RayT
MDLRPVIGRTIVEYLTRERHRVLAVAVANVHVHALVELPDRMPLIRQIAGHAKRHSSRAVKGVLPGSVWGEGGKFKPVRDREHQEAAFGYILYEQGPDAWTWSYRDGSLNGMLGRKRPKKAPRSSKPRA